MATRKHKRKRNKGNKGNKSRNSKKYRMKVQHGCASNQHGGSNFLAEFSNKVLPPVPPALVGPAWSPTSIGDSNHYAKNNYNSQVDYNPGQEGNQINLSVNPWGKMWGGGRKSKNIRNKKRRTLQNGGTFIDKIMPSDILNIGRSASWNTGSIYNSYYGVKPPMNPSVLVQPALLKTISPHF